MTPASIAPKVAGPLPLTWTKPAARLRKFLEVADQGYAICRCNVPTLRCGLLDWLNRELAPLGIGIFRIELRPEVPSVTGHILAQLRSDEFRTWARAFGKATLSVSGIEATIDGNPQDYRVRPASLQGINQQREKLKTLGRPLVFWVDEWLLSKLRPFAPDFWAGRSVVIEFPTDIAETARQATRSARPDILPPPRDEHRLPRGLVRSALVRSGHEQYDVSRDEPAGVADERRRAKPWWEQQDERPEPDRDEPRVGSEPERRSGQEAVESLESE